MNKLLQRRVWQTIGSVFVFLFLLLVLTAGVAVLAAEGLFAQGSSTEPLPLVHNTKEKVVAVYPKMFADHQQSSYQNQTTKAVGHRLWLLPNPDSSQENSPEAVMVAEFGLIVQYGDRIRRIGFDGTLRWEMPSYPTPPAFIGDSNIYFCGTNRCLAGVTADKEMIFSEYIIPRFYSERGSVLVVQPRGDKCFLIQTCNPAPEVASADVPPESDSYHLMLKKTEDLVGIDWVHDFEGSVLPALITDDNGRAVLLDTRTSRITVFDIASGKMTSSFEIAKAGFQQASLDRRGRLIVSLYDAEAKLQLACYSLSGKPIWNCPLPSAERRADRQPPAIDNNNRVIYIWGDTLLVVADGTIVWRHAVPATSFVPYITILGDNSMLLAAGNALQHLDKSGKLLLEICLEPEAQITTPPVVDIQGRIYVGTTGGVYCWE